jgi:uncharacterized protein (DUF2236 family)
LDTLSLEGVAPPGSCFPTFLWDALRPLGRRVLRTTTIGTLPPGLRTKLGLGWTDQQQRRLDRTAAVVRAAAGRVPDRVLHYPMAYGAMRAAHHHDRSRRSYPGAMRPW